MTGTEARELLHSPAYFARLLNSLIFTLTDGCDHLIVHLLDSICRVPALCWALWEVMGMPQTKSLPSSR